MEAIEKRDLKKNPTEFLVKIKEFVLNDNVFEFNSKAYQQKLGAVTGTKSAPTVAESKWIRLKKSFKKRKAKLR